MSKRYATALLTLLLISSSTRADNCEQLPDSTSLLRAELDANRVATIPAGVTYRIADLHMYDNEKLYGPGTLCKSSSATAGVIADGSHITLKDITFSPSTVSGQPNCDIRLADGASDIRITDNDFHGDIYSAICAATDSGVGGSAYVTPATGVLITENTFDGYVRPIFLHSVDNFTIQSNIIKDTLRDAIRLRENDGYGIISGNQFLNIGNGINSMDTQDAVDTFWGGNKLVISDNIVRTTESMGFDIKGVSPTNSDLGSRSIIVANNHISDTRHSGIVLHGDLDTLDSNYSVIINGNIIESVTRVQAYAEAAIWAKGAISYLTISDNQLRSNFARGITIQTRSGSNDGTVKGIQINDNPLINTGVDNADSSIGIYLLGVDTAIVTGNTVGNDHRLPNPYTRFGIFASGVENGIFKNNILRCNSMSQITVLGNGNIVGDNLEISTGCQ